MQLSEKTIDNYSCYIADFVNSTWNGDKFPGSFGPTKVFDFVDYWTLRKRSLQLFKENLYAKGIIKRLLRNEIFTGIVGTSTVDSMILWPEMEEQAREEKGISYSEMLTEQFRLYSETKNVFDYRKRMTFGDFQEQVRFESIICGDGIIVSRINQQTGLPYWDWINGNYIKTPSSYTPRAGNIIKDGVELDKYGRHVAYHVETWKNDELVMERIPCYGEKSGRVISWMVYGTEKLIDDVRGEPLLACILYMLKELDRYRDAESRAAVVNAMLALFVKKSNSASVGSRPSDGLGRLRGEVNVDLNNKPAEKVVREMRIMEPGTIFDDLGPGEEIQSFQTNRPNVNYAAFENAILSGICWALEVPPEIAMLKFQSNYSASRQANNEFEVYLNYRVKKNARNICQPIYEEFIVQACLNNQIDVPGLITAVFTPELWRQKAAWLSCVWTGLTRPSVDPLKEVNASQKAVDAGFSTYDIECRRTSGLGFRQIMQTLAREKKYMKQIGFVPHADEDNNGKPVYDIENVGDAETAMTMLQDLKSSLERDGKKSEKLEEAVLQLSEALEDLQ